MSTPSFRGRFLWHELMTTDPKAAEGFYSKVIGWTTKAFDQDPSYKLWMIGGKSMGGLMAQRVEGGTGPKPQWFIYIGTPNVDATVKQAVELGGKMMRPAMDIPTIGRLGFLNDPQGGVFAVFTPLPAGGGGNMDNTALGDFSWHELMSTNWQAAWDFYSKLFGWHKTDSMDMGPLGTYQMFGLDGQSFGGMFTKAPTPPGPPMWLAYTNVRDTKRAVETIKKLGGTVVNGPMDVPGGGTIAAGIDPQGAAFAVYSKPAAPSAKPAPAQAAQQTKTAAPVAKKAAPAAKKTVPARKKSAAAKKKNVPARKSSSARKSKPAAKKSRPRKAKGRSRATARKRR